MSETESTKNRGDLSHPTEASFLRRKLPYIAVLTLAVWAWRTLTSRISLSLGIGSFWLWQRELCAS